MVKDSSEDFFNRIETQVNGGIQDTPMENTPDTATPETGTESREVSSGTQDWESDSNPYKGRYGDSTREGQELFHENKGLKADLADYEKVKPYKSLINVLEQDAGLVTIVKDYLDNGTAPAGNDMKLGDDFVMDMDEAIADPNSKSAKVLDSFIERKAKKEVHTIIDTERQKAAKSSEVRKIRSQAKEFVDTNKLTEAEFKDLDVWAKNHKMTWDDIYLLKNRDKVNANIAKNSKNQVISQMRSAQSTPTTASSSGSEVVNDGNHNDAIFDLIQKADNNLDNVFGE